MEGHEWAIEAGAEDDGPALWKALGYERQPGASRFVRMLG
jgi:hypothetical protein